LGVGLKTLPCKKENCREASEKFSRILWRRPRPKLGCGAKEEEEEEEKKKKLDGGEWSASRPGRFTPRERAPGTH
jgi:hypothetical protein